MDFFDAGLQLVKSRPLSDSVARVTYDRALNQLVEVTTNPGSQTQSAGFIDGNTFKEEANFTYPIKSVPKFGEKQLAYTLGGNCVGSAHILSDRIKWVSLDNIPACGFLTFVGDNAFAYAADQNVYVLDSAGKQLAKMAIPAPETFSGPRFIGLSDDHTRLAIAALKKKAFSNSWPYYPEVFVYDLPTRRMIFKHALPIENYAAALSPDGKQIAVVEEGILKFIQVN